MKPDHDVPAPKPLIVIKLEVTVRTLGEPPTPEFENMVFEKLAASVSKALDPLRKEGKISGVGWTRIDIPEEARCCACGHSLDSHIEEKAGWRCHSLGPDGYQCECFLRKGRYEEGLEGYNLARRVEQHKKELEEGWG